MSIQLKFLLHVLNLKNKLIERHLLYLVTTTYDYSKTYLMAK